MGGERRVNHQIVLAMYTYSYHTLTQMSLRSEYIYNDSNLQCTTHKKETHTSVKNSTVAAISLVTSTRLLLRTV